MIVTRQPWWFGVVRGVLALLVGIVALVWPELTATALIIVVAGVLLLDGLIGIVVGMRSGLQTQQQATGVLQAFVAIVLGLIGVLAPGFSLRMFAVLVGLWAVGTGLMGLFVAGTVGQLFRLGWLLGLLGLTSLVLGVVILFSPRAGIVLVATLTGINAIIFGLGRIALGLQRRRLEKQGIETPGAAASWSAGRRFSRALGEPELRGQSDVSEENPDDEEQR